MPSSQLRIFLLGYEYLHLLLLTVKRNFFDQDEEFKSFVGAHI